MKVTISTPRKTVQMDLSSFVVMIFLNNIGRQAYEDLEPEEVEHGTAEAAQAVVEIGWVTRDDWLQEVARVEAQNLDEELHDFLEQNGAGGNGHAS